MKQTLNLTFNISTAPYSKSFDTLFLSSSPETSVLFTSTPGDRHVPLAFVYDRLGDERSFLEIQDLSDSLGENSPIDGGLLKEFVGKSFDVHTNEFLVTDKFMASRSGLYKVPLFYKHKWAVDLATGETRVNVKIRDHENRELSSNVPILISESDQEIFTNLSNSYRGRDDYTLYYVEYGISGSSGPNKTYSELLNPTPAFREATTDDINPTTLALKQDANAYTIEDSGSYYTVNLPRNTNYAVAVLDKSYIRADLPLNMADPSKPWFLRISNGHLKAIRPIDSSTTKAFSYNVNEYNRQIFSPYKPYVSDTNRRGIFLDQNTYAVGDTNVVFNESSLPYQIIVRDKDDNLKYGITNNVTLIGNPVMGDPVIKWTNSVVSASEDVGIVALDVTLASTDKIYTTYYKIKDYLEYTGIDFNPFTSTDRLQERILVYLVPTISPLQDSLFYIKEVNQVITEMSQSSEQGDFVGKRSIQDFLDTKTTWASTPNTSQYLPIALVRPSIALFDVDNMKIYDVRKPGGGIKESLLEDAVALAPDVQFMSELSHAEGIPYPGNMHFLVEVEKSIFDTYGKQKIQQFLSQFQAAGTKASIRSYGIDPAITSINVSTTSITINWKQPTDNSNYHYDVYYKNAATPTYAKHNTSDIPITTTTYTLSSLNAREVYNVYVVVADSSNNELGRSAIYSAVPNAISVTREETLTLKFTITS